jgi:hypothetical protein
MYKQIALTVGLALALIATFIIGSQFSGTGIAQQTVNPTNEPNRTISITGEGTISATPDALSANISVVSIERTLNEAIADNNIKMEAVIAALKALGIESKEIQTTQFNVNVEREKWDGPVTGYRVWNQVHVTTTDLDSAGTILDSAIAAGANDVNGVQFIISDREELEREARLAAIADAMSKAEEMVNAAGAQLGNVLTISSYSPNRGYQPYEINYRAMESDAAPAVPLESGELDLRVSVQLTFAIN